MWPFLCLLKLLVCGFPDQLALTLIKLNWLSLIDRFWNLEDLSLREREGEEKQRKFSDILDENSTESEKFFVAFSKQPWNQFNPPTFWYFSITKSGKVTRSQIRGHPSGFVGPLILFVSQRFLASARMPLSILRTVARFPLKTSQRGKNPTDP